MKPNSLYISSTNVQFRSTLDDLLVSKSRTLVILAGLFFTLPLIFLSGFAPTSVMARLFAMSILFGLLSLFAYHQLERRYFLAHLVWEIGLGCKSCWPACCWSGPR
jgi:hypothetical protein